MKKILSIVLAISIILGIFSGLEITANALDSSGKCGNNVSYSYNYNTEVLTISGTGAMYNYTYYSDEGSQIYSSPFYDSLPEKIIISSGITSIGNYAFPKMRQLKNVTISNSITSIGKGAFEYCETLESINIPSGVKTIGDSAFDYCLNLKSVTIPNGVQSIGNSAFSGSAISSIVIPDSVTYLGEGVFGGCCNLSIVSLSKNITELNGTFNGCNISSITIPEKVTVIGDYTFNNCEYLGSISIPDNVTIIGDGAFSGCPNLKSIDLSKTKVSKIGNNAFNSCEALTDIQMPNTLISIERYAFYNCIQLTNITIPDSVTNMAYGIFKNCTGLTNISIGKGVSVIYDETFTGCSKLINISIPDSITRIENYAFCDTAYYQNEENWENDVLYLDKALIRAKDSISGVYNIKKGTTCIADEAFEDCTKITDINIPDSVTSLGKHATFYGCRGLTSISIPGNATEIGNYIFQKCSNLKSVIIPESVKSIYASAFQGCEQLTDVYYAGTETDWNNISIIYNDQNNQELTNATKHYNYLSAHEHSYTSAVTTAPTCGKSGVKTYTCSVCGDTYTETIAATGEHTYTSSVTTAATCTKAGVRTYTCSVCGAKNTEEIAALGHNMKLIEAVEPSGTQTGHNAYYHCTRCDKYFKDVNGTTETTPEAEIIEIQITLTKIEIHSLPDKTDYFVGESFTSDGLKIKAMYSDGTSSVLDTGFTCSVVDTSSAGQKTVTVIYEGKTATFNINIKKVMTENDGAMVVSRVTARPGNNVDVTVELTKNPGIISMKLKVNYDESVMTLKTITDAGILGSATHSNKYSSPYTLTWANDTATENITATGVIVTLSFEVKQGALEGEYPVSVTYNTTTDDDIINFDLDSVDFDITNGTVTVKNYIVGDVNGDGSVTTKDRIVLSRYLADWEGYGEDVIDVNAADVNGDGSVTTKDRIILSRHLADWAGYETMPYAG